ncbi:MAG TPA: hypothetical protein VK131_12595, partial [Candidatus Acidoferrales bacterium]|nr:hypothetical protein [Candidatus Acidoferrales bacterium]
MRYGEVITRSFSIAWRHRYLWLLALFAGEGTGGGGGGAGGGPNFGGQGQGGPGGTGGQVDPRQALQSGLAWLQDNLGLVILALFAVLLLVVLLTALAAVTQ